MLDNTKKRGYKSNLPGPGRVKGSKNKSTIVREQLLNCAEVQEKILSGEFKSPLSFLIGVYSDETEDIKTRILAAKEVASYLHKKQPTATEIITTTDEFHPGFVIKLINSKE